MQRWNSPLHLFLLCCVCVCVRVLLFSQISLSAFYFSLQENNLVKIQVIVSDGPNEVSEAKRF